MTVSIRMTPSVSAVFFLVVVSLFFFLPVSGLFAQEGIPPLDGLGTDDAAVAASGLDLFESARRSLWAGEAEEGTFGSLLDRAERYFTSLEDTAARDYLLGRVALYRGRGELTWGSKGDARTLFETAMELAESSTADRETSEALRLHADAGSSWMITKGLGGIIRMAPQVQEWSDRSLELDPSNPLALIINAQGQINAPKSAGGDPEAAARRLETLLGRADLDDIELFWARVSLAQAYSKLKEKEQAEDLCAMAAEIFPRSAMLDDCP